MPQRRDSRGRFAGGGGSTRASRGLKARSRYVRAVREVRSAQSNRLNTLKAAVRTQKAVVRNPLASAANSRALQNDRRAINKQTKAETKLGKLVGQHESRSQNRLTKAIHSAKNDSDVLRVFSLQKSSAAVTRPIPLSRFGK